MAFSKRAASGKIIVQVSCVRLVLYLSLLCCCLCVFLVKSPNSEILFSKVTIKEEFIDKISGEEETTHGHTCNTVPPKNHGGHAGSFSKLNLLCKSLLFLVLNRTLRVF